MNVIIGLTSIDGHVRLSGVNTVHVSLMKLAGYETEKEADLCCNSNAVGGLNFNNYKICSRFVDHVGVVHEVILLDPL